MESHWRGAAALFVGLAYLSNCDQDLNQKPRTRLQLRLRLPPRPRSQLQLQLHRLELLRRRAWCASANNVNSSPASSSHEASLAAFSSVWLILTEFCLAESADIATTTTTTTTTREICLALKASVCANKLANNLSCQALPNLAIY